MSGAMLHGMGDCTPSLHCGCMSHAPLREQVVALTAERDALRATVARVEALAARMDEHGWRLASTEHWRDSLRAALDGSDDY